LLPTHSFLRALGAAAATTASLALVACGSSGSSGMSAMPAASQNVQSAPAFQPEAKADAEVRAVHGSPDAGPVDIYVYAKGGTRPSKPAVADAEYPQITEYLSVPAGTYTIDVIAPAGSPSTTTPVASEDATVKSGAKYSVVVGGQVSAKTLRFINFIDPAEKTGQTALIAYHASPYVQDALKGPVAAGVYNAAKKAPKTDAELFEFQLAAGASGPAKSGKVSGGEYFLSPLPSALPKAVGFDAGPPASTGEFTSLVTATPSELAAGLKHKTAAQKLLAADKSSEVPAGAHVSVFAVDTKTAAGFIGTLDP
jgi:hypothetical protein